MSYCRWSTPNCDFYIYENVYGGISVHIAGTKEGGTFDSRTEVLEFIQKWINRGKKCPQYVLTRIEDDLMLLGDSKGLESCVD